MFATETLDEIRRRKRALVAQSDLQRAMLRLEVVRLQPYLEYMDTGANLFRKARPIWTVAPPLLGLWAALRLKRAISWLPSAFLVWKLARKGLGLWKKLQQSPSNEDTARTATAIEEL
jgi:hypothetical protein